MAAGDGLIYISGGYDGGNYRADVAALWVYDPETAEWSELAPMPAPRAAHAMAALDGRLYVMGGFVEPEERAPELWIYDIETDRWVAGFAPLPTLREHLAAVALDGLIYVIGGRWGIDNLADLEAYDPETDTWTALAPMPSPRGGLAAAVVDGRIHTFGGEPVTTLNAYATHEAYDPATDAWATLPEMPTPRHGLTAQGVDGALVVIGGGKEAGGRTFYSLTGVVEIYRPDPNDS
jgi:N-acetylneuraminic acid mutarotase